MKPYLNLRVATVLLIMTTTLTNAEMCPDGVERASIDLCPTSLTCDSETLTKCEEISCVKKNSTCPLIECDRFKCWNGSCVSKQEECPSMFSCPNVLDSFKVKCSDNSCASSSANCPQYAECPHELPIKCSTGDCRRRLEDCPSIPICPKNSPVLCPDMSCRGTTSECEPSAKATFCSDSSSVRCSDGTCKKSLALCPTPITCPIGTFLCSNGKCEAEASTCYDALGSISTENKNRYSCLDKTFKDTLLDCPTERICPVDKPVKCWDKSCRETVQNCPSMPKCSFGECETNNLTGITCSFFAPYKCYDNTCRNKKEDCPLAPSCPENAPILCWDGHCEASTKECSLYSTCPSETPVRCPDGSCKSYSTECYESKKCPIGFIRCDDGTCKRKPSHCAKVNCEGLFSFKCENGMCAKAEEDCDKPNNCQSITPFKCPDGACVKDTSECKEAVKLNRNTKLCPDGSVIDSNLVCHLENGCDNLSPKRCADGTCINKDKECPVPSCPLDTPFKCNDGRCVSSSIYCKSGYKIEQCSETQASCADGTCRQSPLLCKPVAACPFGQTMCYDGTCRSESFRCPSTRNCPKSKPHRCLNSGICEVNEDNCPNPSGCPKIQPIKCVNNGTCVKDEAECKTIDTHLNFASGCPAEKPIICDSGACVTNKSECAYRPCPNEGEVLCGDGITCKSNKARCRRHNTLKCPEDKPFVCDFIKKCVSDLKECVNNLYCLYSSPYRCLDGTCRPKQNVGQTETAEDTCPIGIKCSILKPFLCADGSCVESSNLCPSVTKCPQAKPYLCFDRTCAAAKEDCKQRCPSSRPVLCSNGNCVESSFECRDNECRGTRPHQCISGNCAEKALDCIIPELCNSPEIPNSDGTCIQDRIKLINFIGCTTPEMPYKCADGKCVSDQTKCSAYDKDAKEKCSEGSKATECTNRCEDGVPREQCPAYSGCPSDKPFMCPLGVCVKDELECSAFSNCPVNSPFQCADGSCKKQVRDCHIPNKMVQAKDLRILINENISVDTPLAISQHSEPVIRLQVPAEVVKGQDEYLVVKPVPSSLLKNTFSTYIESRLESIARVLPFADKDNSLKLEYDFSVISSVVELTFEKKVKLNYPPVLTFEFDLPQTQGENQEFLASRDICLAKLEGSEWKCLSRLGSNLVVKGKLLSGHFYSGGVYAVILNPVDMTKVVRKLDGFFINNLFSLTIAFFVLIIVFSLLVMVFYRVLRFKDKYMIQKEEKEMKSDKIQQLKDMGANHAGETIGDKLENLKYFTNPLLNNKKEGNEKTRIKSLEKELLKESQEYKTLEENNKKFKARLQNMQEEVEKLNKYKKK